MSCYVVWSDASCNFPSFSFLPAYDACYTVCSSEERHIYAVNSALKSFTRRYINIQPSRWRCWQERGTLKHSSRGLYLVYTYWAKRILQESVNFYTSANSKQDVRVVCLYFVSQSSRRGNFEFPTLIRWMIMDSISEAWGILSVWMSKTTAVKEAAMQLPSMLYSTR